MYLTEWDEEAAKKVWRQESFEDGKIEGKIEGQDEIAELVGYLIKDNRISDLERSTFDKTYRNTLLAEYAIGSYGKDSQTPQL